MTDPIHHPSVPYIGRGAAWGEEELAAMRGAARQDSLSFGDYVPEFEERFAAYVGCEHAIAVRSCTAALFVATKALNLQPGDEVITTPLTFIATSLPLLDAGATVVFADIDPRTFNLDPASVAEKITSRTRAIYPVHYAGLPVDMDPILELAAEHGLAVVEDAAHASGASYRDRMVGTIGTATCFSFQSLKNMTCHGEGGMLTTNHTKLAEAARTLKNYGIAHLPDRPTKYGCCDLEVPYYWDVVDVDGQVGGHYRMNELEAAAGLVQLGKLDDNLRRRKQIARYLSDNLRDVPGITVPFDPDYAEHVYHLYTLLVDEDVVGSKDDFMKRMIEVEGVDVWIQYCPNYLYTIYQRRGYRRGLCPVCEEVFFHQLVNLPIYPQLSDAQVEHMVEAVRHSVEALRVK